MTTCSNRRFVRCGNGPLVIIAATSVAMVPASFTAPATMLSRLLFQRTIALSKISSLAFARILSGISMAAIRLKVSWLGEAGRLPEGTARW